MASSRPDHKNTFAENLRRCVEGLELKAGSNGTCSRVKHLEPRAAEEKKSPQHQLGAIGKQLQGGISKQQHRRSSKGNIKLILSADESNFKALVFEHTCMLSPRVPNGGGIITEATSPLSLQSNSSGSTWESLSQAAAAAGVSSLSQPASPRTPTSLQSKMGFFSQPTSPLSHSASPTPFWFSPSDEAPSNAFYVSSTVPAYNPLPNIQANLNCSPPYPHHAASNESNAPPQCASAPDCPPVTTIPADHNHQAGWLQQGTPPFLHSWRQTPPI